VIANLEPAEHKGLGPVLIAAFFNTQQGAMAIVYTAQGLIKRVPVGELSVLWHYDAAKGKWEADFPTDEENQ
jgi:hypothetical protein